MFELILIAFLGYFVWQKHQETGSIKDWSWAKVIIVPFCMYIALYASVFFMFFILPIIGFGMLATGMSGMVSPLMF